MKRRGFAIIFAAALSLLLLSVLLYAQGGANARRETPRVVYMEPYSDSAIDLTGKDKITFKWQPLPIPSNGRDSYRITVFKEPGYEVVFDQKVDPRAFSIDVSADKFEAGATYRWRVKQRDDTTMIWSDYDIWYFKVIKK